MQLMNQIKHASVPQITPQIATCAGDWRGASWRIYWVYQAARTALNAPIAFARSGRRGARAAGRLGTITFWRIPRVNARPHSDTRAPTRVLLCRGPIAYRPIIVQRALRRHSLTARIARRWLPTAAATHPCDQRSGWVTNRQSDPESEVIK